MTNPTPDYRWLNRLAGKFLVFDGPDGSGKSSQYARLHQLILDQTNLKVCEIREPGGTPIGEEIRKILLDPENHATQAMDIHTEMLLFMASRAQVVKQRIIPGIAAGQVVLADRFLSSTLAYQGTAGGITPEEILAVGKIACGKTWPADLILIFDVDDKTAATRLNPLLDRMEAKGAQFHRRVRAGFLEQANADPQHYQVINAMQDIETVTQQTFTTIQHHFS